MSLTRRIARPLMAGIFITGGIDALQHPETKAPKAEAVAPALGKAVGLPEDTVTLVKINAAAQIGAGILLALGRFPRLASLILAGSLIPTTVAGHRWWEEDDDRTRAMQRTHFLKNLAILGGLILAATDTEGRPGLKWRATHALPTSH